MFRVQADLERIETVLPQHPGCGDHRPGLRSILSTLPAVGTGGLGPASSEVALLCVDSRGWIVASGSPPQRHQEPAMLREGGSKDDSGTSGSPLLMVPFKSHYVAKHGGTHLSSQHAGCRSRKIQ